MADLDRLLRADISHAAANSVEPPDFGPIEHLGTRRRRTQTMLFAATAATAAVVVAVVAAGSSLIIGNENTSLPPASPGPPSPAFRSLPPGDGAKSEAIEPGTYRVPSSAWSAVDFTITFPEDWTVQYGNIYHFGPDEDLSLEAAVVDELFTDACHGKGRREAVGPRVQDLVTALRTQPGPVTGRPTTTTLGGYPATLVDLRIPKRLNLASCREGVGLQIWHSETADNYFVLLPGAVASVYILDVDGQRQVFVTQNRSPHSPDARAELQSLLDSIRIER